MSGTACIREFRVKGKAEQAAFVEVIHIETAENAQRLNDSIGYVQERLGKELILMDNINLAGLVNDVEPFGEFRIGLQIDRGGQSGSNCLEVDLNRGWADALYDGQAL